MEIMARPDGKVKSVYGTEIYSQVAAKAPWNMPAGRYVFLATSATERSCLSGLRVMARRMRPAAIHPS